MNNRPLIEAHRGDSSSCPENTMAAFRRAAEIGADSIELDVHLSADGVWVVIHDPDLARTTDGTGNVSSLPYSAITAFDAGSWKDARFSGERVPDLDSVLRFSLECGVPLNVELKAQSEGRRHGLRFGQFLQQSSFENAVAVVSSFDAEILIGVRGAAPACALGMLGSDSEAVERAKTHQMEWAHVQYRAITPELVADAHAANVKMMTWTVDSLEDYRKLASMGVDKICTNRPADLLDARKQTGSSG